MYKHALKRVFVVLFGLILSIALLSGCDLFNQKPITITKVNNASMQVDDTKNVTVTTTPGDVIIKAVSNNTSIATVLVNKNVLTIMGKAEGEAEITITATKSGYKTASLKFKVIVSKLPSLPNIESVSSLGDIEVAYRTLFENIDLPDKVEVTLDDQTKQTLEVEWDEGNYDGNSTGTYNLEGNLILVEGITNKDELKAKVNVIVPVAATGDVRSVEMLEAKKVPHEVEFVDLDLPSQVKVTLDDGSEICLDVKWDSSNYDRTVEGAVYIIEGSLVLCTGITNTLNLSVTIELTVNIPPKITNLTPIEGIYRLYEGFDLLLSADDADGDELTYRWKDNEKEIYYFNGNPTNFLYSLQDLGRHEVVVQISDGFNKIEEMLIFEANAYPEITSLTASETVVKIDEEITLELVAVDHEDDDLTYSWEKDDMTIDGEESSSLTWTPTEIGACYFNAFVNDGNGGMSKVSEQIKIVVVENYIPEIKKITGPWSVMTNQKEVIFKAEYDHRDTNKELTVHWEADGGVIVGGQDTDEIKWNAPAEPKNYTLTCIVSDGVNVVHEEIYVNVGKPNIEIDYKETVGACQKSDIRVSVDVDFEAEIDISVDPPAGEIAIEWVGYSTTCYTWVAPETLGEVTLSFTIFIDDHEFAENITINVVENSAPIITNLLVNDEPICVDEFLILDVNKDYNFHVQADDLEEDELKFEWYFEEITGNFDATLLDDATLNFISHERSVVMLHIQVNDEINDPVYVYINAIFEDGSVSEIPDETKVETIEVIIDDFNQSYEQNDFNIIVEHFHPDTEEVLRQTFEFMFNEEYMFWIIDRDFIVYDSFVDLYQVAVLIKMEYTVGEYSEVRFMILPMHFKKDDTGVIKLYSFGD